MHTRRTLLLDDGWDLVLNDAGDIAALEGPEATAQNAANECRLFTRDAYFRQAEGVPHYLVDLGQRVPAKPLLKSYIRQAVRRVADVREITGIELEDFDRESGALAGNVYFVTREGENVLVGI
jgi:hypothetical protein